MAQADKRLKRYWHEMAWTDFQGLPDETVAILPVGAVEQHGPHLPVYVDSCLNKELLDRALGRAPESTNVVALPLQVVGKSDEHIRFPGTLSLSAETLLGVLLDIGDSVARAGIKRLVLLNSHGGQPQILDIVARELRARHKMLVVNAAWYALGMPEGLFSESECRHGIHGGEIETSLMLHLRPDLVDMARAIDFVPLSIRMEREFDILQTEGGVGIGWQTQDLHPAGACGNAAAADAVRGAALAEHWVARFLHLVNEVARFPLDAFRDEPDAEAGQ